jgi:hypothetical protein
VTATADEKMDWSVPTAVRYKAWRAFAASTEMWPCVFVNGLDLSARLYATKSTGRNGGADDVGCSRNELLSIRETMHAGRWVHTFGVVNRGKTQVGLGVI